MTIDDLFLKQPNNFIRFIIEKRKDLAEDFLDIFIDNNKVHNAEYLVFYLTGNIKME